MLKSSGTYEHKFCTGCGYLSSLDYCDECESEILRYALESDWWLSTRGTCPSGQKGKTLADEFRERLSVLELAAHSKNGKASERSNDAPVNSPDKNAD